MEKRLPLPVAIFLQQHALLAQATGFNHADSIEKTAATHCSRGNNFHGCIPGSWLLAKVVQHK
jgi:hypothetical protein